MVNTACLIIDMQNGFAHPESHMGKANGVGPQRAIIPVISELVAYCRGEKIPLLWSRQVHFAEDVTRLRRKFLPHSARQGFLPCLNGTWETEFEPQIQSLISPSDFIIEKHRASVFYNTNLESKLRMWGTQVLIIAGCNTEFCVESTVRDAYARDFDLLIIEDGVAGIRQDFHQDSLKKFQAYFGEVIPMSRVPSTLAAL